jgi:DNA-binding transcriptional ArsR family regulator
VSDFPAYRAIADPTRRRILDLLRDEGPLRAGDIAGRFRGMSRPAVSKHLRVLREAGLIEDRESGRERWYHLDALPLVSVQIWLSRYEAYWRDRLEALKRLAESED